MENIINLEISYPYDTGWIVLKIGSVEPYIKVSLINFVESGGDNQDIPFSVIQEKVKDFKVKCKKLGLLKVE
jgi:hypothetical protein